VNRKDYLRAVLGLYGGLPHVAVRRPSSCDHRIASQLFDRQIPLSTIDAAFCLTMARRTIRPPQAAPLQPIRSLAYFLPVIEELLSQPLDPGYLLYLRSKLDLKVQIPTNSAER
jgi:hypothetical protein